MIWALSFGHYYMFHIRSSISYDPYHLVYMVFIIQYLIQLISQKLGLYSLFCHNLITQKVILFLIDVAIHTSIVFGWSSITEILKDENFFRNQADDNKTNLSEINVLPELVYSRDSNQNETCFVDDEEEGAQSQEIALIFTLTTSLLGIFILVFGFIRDYICSGIARFTMFLFLRKRFHLIL